MKRFPWIQDLQRRLTPVFLVIGVLALAAGPALAQGIPPPASYSPTDANGVNVSTGGFEGPAHTISIGQPDQGGLSLTLRYDSTAGVSTFRHDQGGTLNRSPIVGSPSPWEVEWSVTALGQTAIFTKDTSGDFHLFDGTGSLTFDGTSIYTFTALDGTVVLISDNTRSYSPYQANTGQVTSITRPNGEVITYDYVTDTSGSIPHNKRLQSVTNNLGYQLHFAYASDTLGASGWTQLTRVTALNNGVERCSTTTSTCSTTNTWPSLTIGGLRTTDRTVTDATGAVTHYFFPSTSSSLLSGMRRPSQSSGNSITLTRHTSSENANKIATASDGVSTWTYGYSKDFVGPDTVHYRTFGTVTDPVGNVTTIMNWNSRGETTWDSWTTRLGSVTDPLGKVTEYEFDGGTGRLLSRITYPEGNAEAWTYSDEGALTSQSHIPTTGSAYALTMTATYGDCSTPVVCFRPTGITDYRGNTTNYTYSSVHGGVLTETLPAPTSGADRPQTRTTYQQLNAWRLTTPGGTTQSQASAVWRPVAVSACAVGVSPACVGTANEVKTVTAYQAGNSTTYSNLQPISSTVGAGDNSLTATTTSTYDINGDVKTVDGPLPGSADTTWYAYDFMRRSLGQIGPDPDGSGSLLYPASRTVYNADGAPTSVQQGTATAQSQSAFNAQTTLARTDTTYNAQARKERDTQYMGTGAIGLTQYSYDAAGRLQCSALRMNPSVYGSLPSSACALSTVGAMGPDRITRNTYDPASRITVVQTGYATPWVQNTRTQAYTDNGLVDWVEDANGNRSDYAYDPYMRLYRLSFPSPTTPNTANTSDYEEYGYDAGGNITSRRLRSNDTLTFTYDTLNRETVKTVPGGGTADDVFSTWDNLGRRLSARFDSTTSSNAVIWTWDALGRPITETTYGRTLTSAYDLAGRRTQLAWPSSAGAADYEWDLANRMTMVSEDGYTPTGLHLFAAYSYDDLGRRTQLSRGNGATTTWSYTANTRNWSLTQNLSGTTNDVTYGFTLNPAGQAYQRTISNSGYSYVPSATAAQSYTPNGLNQYTAVGGATYVSDARANLTSDAARTYSYDLDNHLTGVSGAQALTLAYDPLGRLRTVTTGGVTTTWLWDGDRLVAEYDNAGALSARYAHGPGPDEPLVDWLKTTSVGRLWFHTDHQYTVVALTDGTGAISGSPLTYDAYGQPAGGTYTGPRFRFTGQTSLPGAPPLWHYKARVYAPGIGRFLQTDPIGYEDSLNLYGFVGNDPFNATDPTGLAAVGVTATGFKSFFGGWEVGFGGADGDPVGAAAIGGSRALALATGAVAVDGPLPIGDVAAIAILTCHFVGPEHCGQAIGTALSNIVFGPVGPVIVAQARIHRNSNSSPDPTQLYHLVDRDTGEIQKIGITSPAAGARYSQPYLRRHNVYYEVQAQFATRFPAFLAQNIELVHFYINNGRLPRMNRNFY